MATISNIFGFLAGISLIMFIIGLISPSLSLFWINSSERTRKKVFNYYFGFFFIFGLIGTLTETDEQKNEREAIELAEEKEKQNKELIEQKRSDSIRLSEIKRKEDSVRNEFNNSDIQIEFLKARIKFNKEYGEAKNEIKKSEIFNSSRKHTCEFSNKYGRSFNNWGGYITTISTNQGGGEVRVVIKTLMDDFVVEFISTIQRGQNMYNVISEFSEGDKVDFGFTFNQELYSSNVKECFDEISLTESGSLINPEFSVTFTSVKKD